MNSKAVLMWCGSMSLAAAALMPSHAAASCTGGSTFKGQYGMFIRGSGSDNIQKYIVGVVAFDGACGVTGTVAYSEHGASNTNAAIAGTYNQVPDGTFAVSFTLPGATAPETYQVGFTQRAGVEALGNESDSGGAASIDFVAQASSNFKQTYNAASMKGTWSISCLSANSLYSDLNYQTFDGVSAITGVDYFNNFYSPGVAPYSGTYQVLSSGMFGGNLVVGGQGYSYVGVLTKNADQIQFVYFTGTPAIAVTPCVGERVK